MIMALEVTCAALSDSCISSDDYVNVDHWTVSSTHYNKTMNADWHTILYVLSYQFSNSNSKNS